MHGNTFFHACFFFFDSAILLNVLNIHIIQLSKMPIKC
jgi:hypothetical protein